VHKSLLEPRTSSRLTSLVSKGSNLGQKRLIKSFRWRADTTTVKWQLEGCVFPLSETTGSMCKSVFTEPAALVTAKTML
jgi:hypothetical protein